MEVGLKSSSFDKIFKRRVRQTPVVFYRQLDLIEDLPHERMLYEEKEIKQEQKLSDVQSCGSVDPS